MENTPSRDNLTPTTPPHGNRRYIDDISPYAHFLSGRFSVLTKQCGEAQTRRVYLRLALQRICLLVDRRASTSCTVSRRILNSAARCRPAYIETDNWTSYTHPEGKIYHARGRSPCVITEADVKSDSVLRAVNAYIVVIFDWASELEVELGSSIELFVEPSVTSGTCGYYLVDHGSRVIFWLQDESSNLQYALPHFYIWLTRL